MDGIELFLLGRALMKLGEEALPEPPGGSGQYAGGTRSVVIVAGDIAAHPDTTVGETAQRTGLPQSQVSGAVARLREAGSVETAPDPADRRRTLVRPAPGTSARVAAVRAAGTSKVEEALARALTPAEPDLGAEPAQLAEVTRALELLARHLVPRDGR
ncbi:MarR family transcriptional regulator [Streptomyces sp. NBC_00503]|uniref:MarR family transcriptional regulator n=1 Tax=Streptomyces sp. NBC_00503 TaxID=2903659 RepID=UPI002E802DF2|nr:helix-turn-helix domain-containing protein [Streptomyces sp. NBC_00503]WUD86526.1 MarR family transcriptional regulator [Streptomyces sp. NBC_00503]